MAIVNELEKSRFDGAVGVKVVGGDYDKLETVKRDNFFMNFAPRGV